MSKTMPKENPKKTESAPKIPRIWRLIIGIALVAFGAWIIYSGVSGNTAGNSSATINGYTINLLVADEQDEITKGLSGRKSIPEDTGMLFIMPEPITPNFWMKDMEFAIDFIWINEEMEVVAITPSIGPDSYPITFSPPEPVKYVLEVNAGLSAHRGWLPGDSVELDI